MKFRSATLGPIRTLCPRLKASLLLLRPSVVCCLLTLLHRSAVAFRCRCLCLPAKREKTKEKRAKRKHQTQSGQSPFESWAKSPFRGGPAHLHSTSSQVQLEAIKSWEPPPGIRQDPVVNQEHEILKPPPVHLAQSPAAAAMPRRPGWVLATVLAALAALPTAAPGKDHGANHQQVPQDIL